MCNWYNQFVDSYADTIAPLTNLLKMVSRAGGPERNNALSNRTTKSITETLEREFFSRFGYPRVLLSDNGPQFVSNDMLETLNRWGTEGRTTPVYHPRANPVERRNQELKKGLRVQQVDGKHTLWDSKLPSILFSIRNRRNERTGYSPAALVLGRECKRPGDWILAPSSPTIMEKVNSERVARELKVITAKPEEIIQKQPKFQVGDTVYYRAHHLSKAHQGFHAGFAPKWWGPVKLAEQTEKEFSSPTKNHDVNYTYPA